MRYKVLIGLVVIVIIFFSGKFPYTLIFDKNDVSKIGHEGDAFTAEDLSCELTKTEGLRPGDPVIGDFSLTVTNHTDRYLVISSVGEITSPGSRYPDSANYKTLILSPLETERVSFTTKAVFTVSGKYLCESRTAAGWSNF